MISGNGQLVRLYHWYSALQDNEEDNYKKYKLIKAICSWVETFVIKGKFWVDGLPVINSNVDIQINSSSNNGNVDEIILKLDKFFISHKPSILEAFHIFIIT